ncbi:sulfite oxidase heme-binding subunit YedZ [Pseudobacteriovorax antillogorgiicola]|uniref:Protein-methionine-sulfoxide reductase heme-binding subunit MsrQ n=1 Tax=Pseudobacteriovorax antillogorgiicola TaxID=1513793 RepID=A0A1Y6B2F4_9BACT|nr:protein-methionine-sulfoxide reductase heme-binding subunit MsrQ [Pseudobacteriovorax antillogorgiicola]TCS59476.1 sulfoxide reductase heme-binding subunit YedZ [Pseudobacteriovorax antillogorgiicola]SME88019.1 sulfoxide reductase heme-binding subunit YedZ [Pseudobacteriovorax antillogorgiicola]
MVKSSIVKLDSFFVAILLGGPLYYWLYLGFSDGLGANPVEAITHETGVWALNLLVLSLTLTPLQVHLKWRRLGRYRRAVGLSVFFYGTLHALSYVVLDHGGDVNLMLEDITERKFMAAGMLAYLLLVPLAITSNHWSVRAMGYRRWKRLHLLAYGAGAMAILHFVWLVKSDYQEPMLYGTVFLVVLLLRPALAPKKIFKYLAALIGK